MAKLRCKGCGEYVPRAEMFYVGAVSAVCSPACLSKQGRSAKQRTERLQRTVPRPKSNKPGVTQETADVVLLRDGGRCRMCGANNIHLHHIEYRSEGGLHTDWNLVCLCQKHHDTVHANKRRWQHVLQWMLVAQYVNGLYYTGYETERLIVVHDLG